MLDALVPIGRRRSSSADGHTAWVNTQGAAAGRRSRGKPPSPAGGVIVQRSREPASRPACCKETAIALVERLSAGSRPARIATRALRAAIGEAQRYGITSVQDVDGSADELELYAEARRAGDLRVRVYSALPTSGDPDRSSESPSSSAVAAQYPDDPLFKAGAVTIDARRRSRDANRRDAGAVRRRHRLGRAGNRADAFNRLVRLLDARGWQVMTHARRRSRRAAWR